MPRETDWSRWLYNDFNRALAESVLRLSATARVVSRILADPEELGKAVGADVNDADAVTEAFVDAVKRKMPEGKSFDGYLKDVSDCWRPNSEAIPPHFGALWFTSLVAHGYPDDQPGFHNRLRHVLGRSTSIEELTGAWEDIAAWTRRQAIVGRYAELKLPPRCDYRVQIGHSWYLAFPHAQDRKKLWDIFEEDDFTGEELAVHEVLSRLMASRNRFSAEFRKDLDEFEKLLRLGFHTDIRSSPFWIAVRREILRDVEPESDEAANLRLLAYLRGGWPVPFVGVREGATIPSGFDETDFPTEPISPYRRALLGRNGDGRATLGAAVLQLGEGDLDTTKAVGRQVRRGVIVLELEGTPNLLQVVSGSQADGAEYAFVRHDLVEPFLQTFGGESQRSQVDGWRVVRGSRVDVTKSLPQDLEHVRHLKRTQGVASPRAVGGIRLLGNRFFALKNHLPEIRWSGATRLSVSSGERPAIRSERRNAETQDLQLPDGILGWAPADIRVNVYAGKVEAAMTIRLDGGVVPGPFASLPAKPFFIEGNTHGGHAEVEGTREIPLVQEVEVSSGGALVAQLDDGTDFSDELRESGLRVRDAIAAMAQARSSLRQAEVMGAFETLVKDGPDRHHVYFDALRAYQEFGYLDIARARRWPDTRVIARPPRLIWFESDEGFRATVAGLTTRIHDDLVRSAATAVGVESWRPQTSWSQLVGPLRLKAATLEALGEVARKAGLTGIERFRGDQTILRQVDDLLNTRTPPIQHRPELAYDAGSGRFSERNLQESGDGVELWTHDNDHSIYVVRIDGIPEAWTFWRHLALLFGISIGLLQPFERRGVRVRRVGPGSYMPLAVGRMATLHHSPLPGVEPGFAWGYQYGAVTIPLQYQALCEPAIPLAPSYA